MFILEYVTVNIEYVTPYLIWSCFYNLKNLKNTHGKVLLLGQSLQRF